MNNWHEFSPDNFKSIMCDITQEVDLYFSKEKYNAIEVHKPAEILNELEKISNLEHPTDILHSFLRLYADTAPNLVSSGYFARQFSSPIPAAAALDAFTSLIPQPGSFFEVGPIANAIDKLLQSAFEERLGWMPGSGRMVSTSGGSLANLTALLAARNSSVCGSWEGGLSRHCEMLPAVAMSVDAHYSLERSVGVLGLGTDQIIKLPVDKKRRIDVYKACKILDECIERNVRVFCLVASAGTTSTGSIDQISELAKICSDRGIWLHVDGAHAGSFIVSDKLKPRLAGIESADSFCLDAHKTMFVPAMCTLLFYRDAASSEFSFTKNASYVFSDRHSEIDKFESGGLNFECTKRPGVISLWLAWTMYGRQVFERKLDYLSELTQTAYSLLREQPDFITHNEPETNIICFSHHPDGLANEDQGAFQITLRDALLEDGRVFLSKTDIDGLPVLRIVIMNHDIDASDILSMIEVIRSVSTELLKN